MKSEVLLNNTLFVGVAGKGGTISLSLGKRHTASSGRVNGESIVIYSDPTVNKAVLELKNYFETASRKANVRMELNGMYAIPASSVIEVNDVISRVDAEFDEDGSYIQDNYDKIRAANRDDVEKAIESFPAKEKVSIMKSFDRDFPSKERIAAIRRLNIMVLASPWSGEISGLEVLADRALDDAQQAYKRAVFSAIVPVYEALASYYTKSCNGLEINMKSRNFFTGTVLPDLRENNEIRRDGFTSNLISVLEKAGDGIFDDGMMCYNIVLNILHEAKELNVDGILPNLAKLEVSKLKLATSPNYLLTAEQVSEDIEDRIPLETMMGVTA